LTEGLLHRLPVRAVRAVSALQWLLKSPSIIFIPMPPGGIERRLVTSRKAGQRKRIGVAALLELLLPEQMVRFEGALMEVERDVAGEDQSSGI
jgi:hypothetical protein